VDEHLGRHVANREEHDVFMRDVIVVERDRVGRSRPVLVEADRERLVVHDGDRGRQIGVGFDRLAALPPQAIDECVHLVHLFLPGLDGKYK
jgi:hypothetical protein